jgi:hypothetical protein
MILFTSIVREKPSSVKKGIEEKKKKDEGEDFILYNQPLKTSLLCCILKLRLRNTI